MRTPERHSPALEPRWTGIHPRTAPRRCRALGVSLLVVLSLLLPRLALGDDVEGPPGTVQVLLPGSTVDQPLVGVTEDRYTWYLDLQIEVIDLRAQVRAHQTIEGPQLEYTAALERRVQHLESPGRQPAVYLVAGFGVGIVTIVLAALVTRWASGGFDLP